MWLFTKYGFITAVCARQGNGEHGQPVDPDRIAVRFRTRPQLENFQKRFPALAAQEVWEDPSADYRYRIFVEKPTWVRIATELAEEVDYDKFKPSVIDFEGKEEYKDKLLQVWGLMYQSQTSEEAKKRRK
jgi:hypothetical protein